MHFSRTLRSLTMHQPSISLVGLISASLLMLLWLGWFFFAPVVISVQGEIINAAGDGYVQATFAGATEQMQTGEMQPGQIQPGQVAQLYLDAPVGQTIAPIPALVAEVIHQPTQTQVDLYAQLDPSNAAYFAEQPRGTVAVAVEQISPAILLLRAAGQFADAPTISFVR